MLDIHDADLTLPSLPSALPGEHGQWDLVLTIVFHPDTARIGESARMPWHARSSPWVLGRRSPCFGPDGSSGQNPLHERHVSRRALSFTSNADELRIRRLPQASRCRCNGQELFDEVTLGRELLLRGVPLLLGHGVVLLLRLTNARAVPGNSDAVCEDLLGSSACMRGLRIQIQQAARSDLDVLIRGETGTGKELAATAIHQASPRHGFPLVSINMAAIPTGLASATLFGSCRGAFTGATKASEGYFGQAEGGTLFLDEIGDTPSEIQPQLLRALQQREIQAVGGPIRRADVRVISATDAQLEGEGCDFKAALRHRLGACELVLAPLREHPEDIGELLLHFLQEHCQRAGKTALLPGPDSPPATAAAWAGMFHAFLSYHWPGNVRELDNFAGQVVIASAPDLTLPDAVSRALMQPPAATPLPEDDRVGVPLSDAGSVAEARPQRSIRDINEDEFDRALQSSHYEVAHTARHLEVSRQAVYRRMAESSRYRLAGQVPVAEMARTLASHSGDATAAALQLRVSVSGLRARLRDSDLVWF